MTAPPVRQLAGQWRDEATTLERRGATAHAATLRSCADDLEERLDKQELEPLTLAEAAELSGYSADHLGRLVREGKIPNAGRHGAPRILRQDVPLKAGTVAPQRPMPDVDRTQIVRSAISAGA